MSTVLLKQRIQTAPNQVHNYLGEEAIGPYSNMPLDYLGLS